MQDLNNIFGGSPQGPLGKFNGEYTDKEARGFIQWSESPPCLKAALAYASRYGWFIFPAPYGEKKSHKKAEHSGGSKWGMTNDLKQIWRDFKKWPDAGIGIPTGADNNIFVLEGDTPKGHGVDGLASLAALEAQHGALPATLMAESPSGSLHRYYQHPGNGLKIISRTLAGYPGVDIKGDGGMVIAPPSRRGDGVYRWLNNLPIAKAPQWLLDLVTADKEPAAGERNVWEEFSSASIEDIKEKLAEIPNSPELDRETWIKIGIAVHYETGGSEEGFEAWDAWSQTWEVDGGYNAEDTRNAWEGFKPRGDITFGSIKHYAKREAGTEQAGTGQTNTGQTTKPKLRLTVLKAHEIISEPVNWEWENRIARGALTIISGDPGQLKSQITYYIASRVSKGETWCDGGGQAPLGNTFILSAEDTPQTVIVPRLEAAGADLERVRIIKATVTELNGKKHYFSLQEDLKLLALDIAEWGDVALLIVDPVSAFMGSIDSHRTTDVRAVLGPLADFAEEHNIAVLGVMHPPKAIAGNKSVNAISGSLAFGAAARLTFLAMEDQEDDDEILSFETFVNCDGKNPRRLLLAGKNNLGPKAAGIGYRLGLRSVTNDIQAPYVDWDDKPVNITADEALAAAAGHKDSKVDDAKEWLHDFLKDGPKPADEVKKAADEQDITSGTLRRAKDKLKVASFRSGYGSGGGWQWGLPTWSKRGLVAPRAKGGRGKKGGASEAGRTAGIPESTARRQAAKNRSTK